ncbi:13546_t:CDS:2, partial [Dentiscutata heterogama]
MAQKLNDNNVDSQAIMSVTLHHSMAGLNHYRNQNIEQRIKVANIAFPTINQILPRLTLNEDSQNKTMPNSDTFLNSDTSNLQNCITNSEDQDIIAEVPKILFNEITNSDNIISTKKWSSEYQLGDKKAE